MIESSRVVPADLFQGRAGGSAFYAATATVSGGVRTASASVAVAGIALGDPVEVSPEARRVQDARHALEVIRSVAERMQDQRLNGLAGKLGRAVGGAVGVFGDIVVFTSDPAGTARAEAKLARVFAGGAPATGTATGGGASASVRRPGGGGDDVVAAVDQAFVSGGAGNDTVSVAGAVGVYGGSGNDVVAAAGAHLVSGGDGNDTIAGAQAHIVHGGDGDDTIAAMSSLLVTGGDGDDTIVAGGGARVIGGRGNDTIYVRDDGDAFVLFNAGDGQDTVISDGDITVSFLHHAAEDMWVTRGPDGTIHIGFDGSRDTMTIRAAGDVRIAAR